MSIDSHNDEKSSSCKKRLLLHLSEPRDRNTGLGGVPKGCLALLRLTMPGHKYFTSSSHLALGPSRVLTQRRICAIPSDT